MVFPLQLILGIALFSHVVQPLETLSTPNNTKWIEPKKTIKNESETLKKNDNIIENNSNEKTDLSIETLYSDKKNEKVFKFGERTIPYDSQNKTKYQKNATKEILTKNETDNSRKNKGRSYDVDIDKVPDYNNNVFTLPISSSNKDEELNFDFTTISLPRYVLTTPKTPFFDEKFKEAVKSINKELSESDFPKFDNSSEILNFSLNNLIEEVNKNPNNTSLVYNKYKKTSRNDDSETNKHKDWEIEKATSVNFEKKINNTFNEIKAPSENDLLKAGTKRLLDDENSNNVRKDSLLHTTRKSIPSITRASLRSNTIADAGIVKSVTYATELKDNKNLPENKGSTYRGAIKYADYQKNSSKNETFLEPSVQENQVNSVKVIPPAVEIEKATTIKIFEIGTPSDINNILQKTTNTEEPTTAKDINNAFQELSNKQEHTTINDVDTTEEYNKSSEDLEDTAKIISLKNDTKSTIEENDSSKYLDESVVSTTLNPDTVTVKTTETTESDEKLTTDSLQFDKLQEMKMNTHVPTTELDEKTTTEPIDLTMELTTEQNDELSTLNEETTSVETTTLEPLRTSKFINDESSQFSVDDITTENIKETTTIVFIQPQETTVATTPVPELTSLLNKQTAGTITSNLFDANKLVTTTIPSVQTTKNIDIFNTTQINFYHIKNTDQNHTTILPDILRPNEIYKTPEVDINFQSLNPVTTEEPDSSELNGNGSNGAMVAILIACVGGVCLLVLVGLLVIMRKRQKHFKYGKTCRPVSLDNYSVDNISVFNSVRRKAAIRSSKMSYGNPAFDDPVCTSHPLNYQALSKFSKNEDEIKAEFEEIPQIIARTSELPEGCAVKNRYSNVIPLPETRVFLKSIDGCENSDYINANYVTGPKNIRKYYIACQAPMANTVDDFWRMIWEQQSKVILMITYLYESGIEKCVDYLPPSEVLDCHRLFGDYQVTLKKREVKEKYIISSLQLKNMVTNSWRDVTHFWYMGWPEKGVPSEANSIIAFLLEARSFMKTFSVDKKIITGLNDKNLDTNPVVVHCSPGTGRTGVIITCDIAIRDYEQTRLVDIPKIVYRIRRDRAGAVQTKEQYMFIYKVVNLYASKLSGDIADPKV